MGAFLDLAVASLALLVVGSLALLTWTLAVSVERATRRLTDDVTAARLAIAELETRIRTRTKEADTAR